MLHDPVTVLHHLVSHADDAAQDAVRQIWVVLRKRAPMCDIERVALDRHVLVDNRLVQCATYTV